MNGFELCERVLSIDINVKVCFMPCGEINCESFREVHPSISLGCFIRKPLLLIIWLTELGQNWIR
jgi:hypothetical protein